jgi:hypothetical protein
MAASVSSPADVLNLSLRRIGYDRRVGSLLEGSKAASAALDLYAQTRDQLLRKGDWNFASGMVNGTLQKSAPAGGYFDAPWDPATNPQQPWRFQYAYPSDAVKIRSVRPQPGFLFDPLPTPTLFDTANDTISNVSQMVVLCNTQDAVLVYTRRVTDPTARESDFLEALAAEIGRRLAPILANMEATKMEAQDAAIATAIAERVQG